MDFCSWCDSVRFSDEGFLSKVVEFVFWDNFWGGGKEVKVVLKEVFKDVLFFVVNVWM